MREPTLEDIFARRGAITRIATELGISTAAVSQWRRVPDDRVLDVARILNLTPETLRPDLTEPPAPKPEGHPRMTPARPTLRRRRRTKVIATLGPASATIEVIERLYRAGADVFRLNFSHGSHEDHAARIQMIREVEQRVGRPIGILADVQGPKLRVGQFQGGRVQLQTGQTFRLDLNPTPGDVRRVNLPHKEIISAPRSAPRCCSTTASSACASPTSDPTTWKPKSSSAGPCRTARASTSPTSPCPSRR